MHWQVFDSKLYMSETENGKQYRKTFHRRNIFIDFVRSGEEIDGFVYTPSAYFLHPNMVRFEFNGRLFKHGEINTFEFPDRVFSATPFVSMGNKCLCYLQKVKKPSVFSLGTGLDFGCYKDVCDVFGLFRDEMFFIDDKYFRFKALGKLSVLEINVIAATLILASIVKIVAPNDFGLTSARLSQLAGHIISVDNKNAVEHYLAQNLNDFINKEFVKQSTQV
jgi:hypothetical protein